MEKKRNPWLAGFLSLCAFGLGQLYCGRIKRAIIQVVLLLIGYNSILYLFFEESLKPFNVIIPILFLLALYPYFVFDAFLIAKKEKTIILKNYNKVYVYILYPIMFIIIFSYTDFISERMHAYKIPSAGMEDTFFIGDYFMADKTAYLDASPERGDIVIFHPPHNIEQIFIKRCIAIQGDIIEIRNKVIFINGTHQENLKTVIFLRTQIQPKRNGKDSFDNFGPIIIPDDHFFMMGDNRDNSSDSRIWGTVPKELIIGKARTIHWSNDWNRIGMIPK